MKTILSSDKKIAGREAALLGSKLLRQALKEKGHANIIVATGMSQFDLLEILIKEPGIAWDQVTIFHLDEYVGLPITHPASFRLYLWERFQKHLPLPVKAFHYVDGSGDPQAECKRLGKLISECPIDVCFAGIGENSHLAFNDPPADFKTEEAYLVVNLDAACRQQQFGEGWFPTLEDVPKQAISMSIRQIMKAKSVIITATDTRKAVAVQKTLEGPITPDVPASILQQHEGAYLFLDPASAALLKK